MYQITRDDSTYLRLLLRVLDQNSLRRNRDPNRAVFDAREAPADQNLVTDSSESRWVEMV